MKRAWFMSQKVRLAISIFGWFASAALTLFLSQHPRWAAAALLAPVIITTILTWPEARSMGPEEKRQIQSQLWFNLLGLASTFSMALATWVILQGPLFDWAYKDERSVTPIESTPFVRKPLDEHQERKAIRTLHSMGTPYNLKIVAAPASLKYAQMWATVFKHAGWHLDDPIAISNHLEHGIVIRRKVSNYGGIVCSQALNTAEVPNTEEIIPSTAKTRTDLIELDIGDPPDRSD